MGSINTVPEGPSGTGSDGERKGAIGDRFQRTFSIFTNSHISILSNHGDIISSPWFLFVWILIGTCSR